MKNLDSKKIALLVIIILAIALVVFFVITKGSKKNKENEASKEETTIAENATKYFTKLTYGHGTAYKGLDIIFNKDSVTYKDLSVGNILTVAYDYAIDNYNSSVSNLLVKDLKANGYDTDNMEIISGENIRNAIKKLFGVDFTDQDFNAEVNYKYKYYYNSEHDVYLRSTQDTIINSDDSMLTYKIIKTTSKNDKLFTEIAVIYIYKYNGKYYYTKDAQNKEKVYESDKLEPKEDKLNEFNHFTITLKKDKDNYIFEKIEKNK